jgi:DNA-binding NtrC family response regulator
MIEVLLVEGDRATHDALTVALERFACFSVDIVREQEFLAQAQEKPYRAVFIDDSLGADGVAGLLRRFKDLGQRAEIVLLAGDRTMESLARAKLNLNISTFVKKPVGAVEIYRCLSKLRERFGEGGGR